MSWNARRTSIVVLALIAVVSAVWLDQGRAQDEKKTVEKKREDAAAAEAERAKLIAARLQARQARLQMKGGVAPMAPAPNPAVNPDGFLNNGIHLVKDEKGRGKQIEAALDYIGYEDWATAVERLQKLLEIDEDVFVRLKRQNAEGSEVFVWVSAKQEADRLIGTLPAAGLDFYKSKFGAKAADLLKKAKTNGDPGLLNDLMKKYAHTDAGAEAIKLLGDYKFDRGEYMPALLCYSKLINRLGEEKAPPTLLAKAAWAAHLAPPSSTGQNTVTSTNVFGEKELWKMLRARTREVQFGEQAIAVEELQEHVAKLDRTRFEQNATDSLLYRATASRGNQLVGGPAFMVRQWQTSMLYDKDASDAANSRIEAAKRALETKNQPIIPAFAPISLTATNSKGDKIPLLVYKNYFGVMAVDLRNGGLAWASPSNWSLQRMLNSPGAKQSAVGQWLNYYIDQNQHPQILFENSTVGTLSTDGQFVYSVEDLAIPPLPTQNLNNNMVFPGGMNNNVALDKDIEDAISHNRLLAFNLAGNSGKLTWALGDDEKDPLRDHYFLGPPLPLAGKLYLLAEKQQEIRLICLDPSTKDPVPPHIPKPTILSTQTLGLTQEKMQSDALRRTWAAHLSYGEGILVCPTNAGAVFGVNLLENSLVWAYPYREKSDAPPQPMFDRFGRPLRGNVWVGPGGMPQQSSSQQNSWKVSAPVISDGKVVFTAPDARSLHCVNLRDGSPVWRRPKLDDDLYLGNVHDGKVLIVGKKSVRGLSLVSGETLWTLEVGTPSGQGIGSDNVYYLPLKEAAKGKDPQIVGIDMAYGRIVSSSKARPNEDGKLDVPGNLLFAEGKVVSLTADKLTAYPQLKVKIAEMDDRIAKNPNDPIGLTERGDLRLDKGDLAGAIDDLSTALKNKPDKETRDKARAKLYDTLTAYIADHFNDAEKYLKDYEDLCKLDLDAVPPAERGKLEAEQRRRRATYLWLVGKGREEQGRLVEAFEKYQQFAKEAGKQSELVPAVDDRQVKAAPDVWSRGRIIAMMNNAKPEHRQPLEKLIADKWDKLRQTNDLDELRAFVRMFGSASNAGKEARLELVERLMDQKDGGEEHPLLEAELELNQFRTGRHSAELAARATEALARLYTRKGLLEDAAYCYRKLGKEYARIVIRDGKTGREIYDDDAATDKRLLPYLDDPQPLGAVKKFGAKKQAGNYPVPYGAQLFQFEHSGENLPYFRHHIVGLNFSGHRFTLLDRNLEDDNRNPKEVWSAPLSETAFQMLTGQVLGQQLNAFRAAGVPGMMINPNSHPNARFPYSTVGHLIVLPLGHRVFGIDPVNHRVLWEKNLSEGAGPLRADRTGRGPTWNPQMTPPLVDPRDGSVLVTYNDNWAQRLGQVSPFQGQTICVQSVDRLSALDPLTGRTLWSRMDVNSRNYLFSDEDYVFVVELDNQNAPHSTRVFRAADGISVKEAPDFAALFAKRLQVFGRYLLLSEPVPGKGVVVRLYDAASGQDVWKQNYAARSFVANSEDATLTGIVEPDGKVHVIDLRARKEVMSGQLSEPTSQLRNVHAFHLLADRHNFYFAAQSAENNGAAAMMGMPSPSNVMTQLGMRTVPVNGLLHAFDRRSSEHAWYAPVKDQYLILDQFEDLPLLFFTAHSAQMPNGGLGVPIARPGMRIAGAFAITVLSIQKRDARTVFSESLPANTMTNIFGVRVDRRANTVELLSQLMKITFSPKADDEKKPKPAAAAPRGAPAPASRPKAADRRAVRPAIDRARIREIAPPLPPG